MELTVVAARGLHARPAAEVVRAVLDSGGAVRLGRPGGKLVDARSIVSVLSLDIQAGEEVVVAGGDEGLVRRLAALVGTAPGRAI
jgi:phosphocarrier protein HPr